MAGSNLCDSLTVRPVVRQKSRLRLSRNGHDCAERSVQLDQANVEDELDRLQERAEVAHPGAEEASTEVTESPDRVSNRVEVEELVIKHATGDEGDNTEDNVERDSGTETCIMTQ